MSVLKKHSWLQTNSWLQNKRVHFLIIALSFLFAYGNSFNNQFLWDDEFLIDENNYITSFSNLGKIFSTSSTAGFGTSDSFFRPMQMLAYTIAYSVGGDDTIEVDGQQVKKKKVWPYHALNFLLHTINGCLLYLLILLIWSSSLLAIMTALLWGLHPTHTEAITYMSGTADPLSVIFVLATCIFYILARRSPSRRAGVHLMLSALFFPLALLAKEAVIILPGLLMIFEFCQPQKRWRWNSYIPTLPHWLIAFVYLGLRETLLNFEKTFDFYPEANIYTENIRYRLYTFLATLPEYLKILLYPTDLHMERQFPVFVNFLHPKVVAGACLVAVGLFFIWRKRKITNSKVTFLFLWFFISFVPMSGVLIPANSFILEHWLYLPSIGLFLGLAFVLQQSLHRWKKLSVTITLLIILALSLLTRLRNQVWRTPISFYTNILEHNRGTARVHNNIAMAYSEKKKFSQAIAHYEKSIAMADKYPQPHFNMARIYIQQEKYDLARKHLLRSLEIQPKFHFAANLLKQLDDFLRNQKNRSQ